MYVDKINDNIIHLSFLKRADLCRHFIRFQEHYESPEFAGKIFTLGQYKAWYAQERGAFTYEKDWSGFNLPSYVFKPFFDGLFDPLTKEEQILVNMFRHKQGRYYVIGTFEKDPDRRETVNHEICHGLYYTEDEYKEAVDKLIEKHWEELKGLREYLTGTGGYHEDVVVDECHAYVSGNEDKDWEHGDFPLKLWTELRKLKDRYLKK
jgi:hypothetical protein